MPAYVKKTLWFMGIDSLVLTIALLAHRLNPGPSTVSLVWLCSIAMFLILLNFAFTHFLVLRTPKNRSYHDSENDPWV